MRKCRGTVKSDRAWKDRSTAPSCQELGIPYTVTVLRRPPKDFLSEEDHLDKPVYQLMEGHDEEEQRRYWYCCHERKTGYVLNAKGDDPHFTYDCVTICQVGQRLDVSSSQDGLAIAASKHPFIVEVGY